MSHFWCRNCGNNAPWQQDLDTSRQGRSKPQKRHHQERPKAQLFTVLVDTGLTKLNKTWWEKRKIIRLPLGTSQAWHMRTISKSWQRRAECWSKSFGSSAKTKLEVNTHIRSTMAKNGRLSGGMDRHTLICGRMHDVERKLSARRTTPKQGTYSKWCRVQCCRWPPLNLRKEALDKNNRARPNAGSTRAAPNENMAINVDSMESENRSRHCKMKNSRTNDPVERWRERHPKKKT